MLFALSGLLAQFDKAPDLSRIWVVGVLLVVLVFGLALVLAALAYGKLWFQAYMSNAQVRMFSLIGMSLRQVNPGEIVQAKIMAMQAGHRQPTRRPASPRAGSRPITWPAATCRT